MTADFLFRTVSLRENRCAVRQYVVLSFSFISLPLLYISLCWLQNYCQILHGDVWQKVHMINQHAKYYKPFHFLLVGIPRVHGN